MASDMGGLLLGLAISGRPRPSVDERLLTAVLAGPGATGAPVKTLSYATLAETFRFIFSSDGGMNGAL
jgi:hypothetical protein